MQKIREWFRLNTPSGTEPLKSCPPDDPMTETLIQPGPIVSSGSGPYPNFLPNPHPAANMPIGHYASTTSGTAPILTGLGNPALGPTSGLYWPPNTPHSQAINPRLLRLPDMVAEKLVLIGARVHYMAEADYYDVAVKAPHYASVHVPHDANAGMWASSMEYLVQKANRPVGPASIQQAAQASYSPQW